MAKKVQKPATENEVLQARVAELEAQLAAHGRPVHVPIPYPAMRFHKDGRTLTVADATADAHAAKAGFGAEYVPASAAFPAYRYHKKYAPRKVESQEEADSLGAEWSADPA